MISLKEEKSNLCEKISISSSTKIKKIDQYPKIEIDWYVHVALLLWYQKSNFTSS